MRIMGIDPSLANTGVAIVENTKMMNSFSIKSSPLGKTPTHEIKRILTIKQRIIRIIEKFKPELVVIEGVAMMVRRGGAMSQLSGLNYLIREFVYNNDIDFLIIPPTMLKKFIIGKGIGGKELMLLETYKRYKISFSDNNICDAYGLALIGDAIKNSTKTISTQKEVINKIKYQYE